MRPLVVRLLWVLALFVVPCLSGKSCNFDKNDESLTKKDPCKSIKLDPKRKYKTTDNHLELHVRMCQICEYNCDFKKDKAKDNLANLTKACTSEEGCSKRYISYQGCPYTPPSDYFEKPQCFFDDSDENLVKDPCTGYGDGEDEDKPEENPKDKWDPTHKYAVISEPDPAKKMMHAEHLFTNAFVDVCPPPNSYDIFGIIIAAFLCILEGCTRRYLGWRVCPADADHAIMQFSIDVNSMTEVLKMLMNVMLEVKYCVDNGGLCRDNKTNVIDTLDRFNVTKITGKNATEIAQDHREFDPRLLHCVGRYPSSVI